MEFDWHPAKAASNLRKHGVAFEQAASIFRDPLARSKPDDEHSDGEDRWVTIGQAEGGRPLVVTHTSRQTSDGALVRIISARRATRRERSDYEERIGR